MLHMQHAHVVALIVRQHEAARLQAQRDAVARARRAAAAPQPGPQAVPLAPRVQRPRAA